jgi:hydrogenase/urease accessory protein HupE
VRRGALAATAGAWLVLVPASASAHLFDTGLGPIFDGISHLFLSFDDLLPVVAMALLGGLNGKVAARRVLFALPGAWLAGGIAGYLARVAVLPAGTTSLSLLSLGILVAADRRLAPGIVTVLAIAAGLLHGWLNGSAIAIAGREAIGLAGIVGSVFVLVALFAAPVASLRVPWTRIALRVAGSWIAAIGLLLLGWALSGRL